MKQLPRDFLTVGRGAEYVFCGDDTITLVSGDKCRQIAMSLSDPKTSTLVYRLDARDASPVVLLSGSSVEIVAAFVEVRRRLTASRGTFLRRHWPKLLGAVAVIALVACFVPGPKTETAQTTEQAIPGLTGAPAQTTPDAAASMSIPNLVMRKPSFIDVPDTAPPVPATPAANTSAAPVKPDDTAKPAATPAAVSEKPVEKTEATPPAPVKADDPKAVATLPAYSPTLYAAPDDAGKPESKGEAGFKASLAPAMSGAETKPAATKDETRPADAKPDDKAASAAPAPAETKAAASGDGKQSGEPLSKEQVDAMQKATAAAVGKMTPDQQRKLLLSVQQLNASGDGITQGMLSDLPSDIAGILSDSGVAVEDDQAGTMNILPSDVVDKFRGRDGIATIPENFSWYARRGGPVLIPLPGGGDVKSSKDLKDFGLQP